MRVNGGLIILSATKLLRYSRVAQLVARLAHTQKVIGSNPISALVEDKATAPPISQHTVMRG